MTSRPKIAVIGHSFIKRLARDIRDRCNGTLICPFVTLNFAGLVTGKCWIL